MARSVLAESSCCTRSACHCMYVILSVLLAPSPEGPLIDIDAAAPCERDIAEGKCHAPSDRCVMGTPRLQRSSSLSRPAGLPAQASQLVRVDAEVDSLDHPVGDLQHERANRLVIGGGNEGGTVIDPRQSDFQGGLLRHADPIGVRHGPDG